MQTLIRTTLRLTPDLKKRAQSLAVEKNTTMQAICNVALREYLDAATKQKAKKIIFQAHNLGVDLDNLTRDDYYDEPTNA